MINSFMLKNFSIGLLNDEGKEQKFRFSLYLCANDSYAAGGWIIDDVSIGGMSPFLWLEELSQIDYIPPEFLICRIKYRPQVTYDICEAAENAPQKVLTAPRQSTTALLKYSTSCCPR